VHAAGCDVLQEGQITCPAALGPLSDIELGSQILGQSLCRLSLDERLDDPLVRQICVPAQGAGGVRIGGETETRVTLIFLGRNVDVGRRLVGHAG